MDGFYSIWTQNYMKGHKDSGYKMRDYELLTLVMSLCQWQKHNGNAMLIADKYAIEYLENIGIASLFKAGVKELVVDKNINSEVYWAAGKLYALRQIDRPMAMIDLDLIVWKNLDTYFNNSDILVIHREEINDATYPDVSKLHMKDGFSFPNTWDMTVLPCNTALLYIEDDDFRRFYADTAIDFMKSTAEEYEHLWHMVFAEQRLLSILAKDKGKEIISIFPLAQDIGMQDMFTHVWGHKSILKYNYSEKILFCNKIMKRLKEEYTEAFDIVKKVYKNYEE